MYNISTDGFIMAFSGLMMTEAERKQGQLH